MKGKGATLLAGAAAGLLIVHIGATLSAADQQMVLERMKKGKEAFGAACLACHDAEKASSGDRDRTGWEATVDEMISNGAQLTAEQKTVVVDYLAARSLLMKKCSVCHSPQRPLSKNKNLEGWKATVTRMSGKRPGHLSEGDIEQIVGFLAAERPAP